ncbi:AI-2E family transporter [Nostocoides sp. F2B08]|uniref:AI-2E family transporter n=1 Tax=Nostocoides sp. F2B08 TaxID=2653936 RepID=UPI001262D916|nr:AI-2E family transporter [Tetrasphaera sp. F2B08]KAB7745252.1 AI-2E family transporter [Tetrasphaera sp. F2B08]
MEAVRLGDPGSRLHTWGMRGWLLTGAALGVVVVISVLGQIPGLVVPLVIAAVLGALFAPVVDRLARHRIPRSVGSVLVMALLAGIVTFSLWLMVVGIADEGPKITESLDAGLASVEEWLTARGVAVSEDSLTQQLNELLAGVLGGAVAFLPSLLSGAVSFFIGIAIGGFLVYYMLVDWHGLTRWVGRNVGWTEEAGAGMVDDAVDAVRRYFGSLTLSAIVTAVLIGAAAWLLDVPLAFTIAVITLVTSYIPYLGAIFSGAFATVVTLGAAGLQPAVIMLLVILVVQNIVQTVVLTRLTSTSLKMHPIVTLGSTIVGAAVAGALGAMLSAPAVAVWILVVRRLRSRPAPGAEPAVGAAPQNDQTSGT